MKHSATIPDLHRDHRAAFTTHLSAKRPDRRNHLVPLQIRRGRPRKQRIQRLSMPLIHIQMISLYTITVKPLFFTAPIVIRAKARILGLTIGRATLPMSRTTRRDEVLLVREGAGARPSPNVNAAKM